MNDTGAKNPLIEMRGLGFEFPDGHRALDEVDLTIHEGDRVAIVGQNGAGKTTLIRHMNGILTPTAGEIFFRGQPIDPGIQTDLRSQIGIVFQDPDDQLFSPTLYEDVAFGPLNFGLSAQEIETRVTRALTWVGLVGYEDKAPQNLSYGQRKRAALATVLAMDAPVIVLDEPTSNLDPKNERALLEVLSSLPRTLIVVSHDIIFLYQLCRRAVVLQRGRVHHDYTMEDLVSQRSFLKEHGLDFTFRCLCCDNGTGEHHHLHEDRESSGHFHSNSHTITSAPTHTKTGSEAREPAIEVSNYSYRYPDGAQALQEVSFSLQKGETLALIGENGAGKSTLAKSLAGVLLGRGRICIQDTLLTPQKLDAIRFRVGLVFQDPSDQLFCPTTREDVAFGPLQMGLGPDLVDQRVQEALGAVDMLGWEDRPTHHMSMGQRKRIAIATVLGMHPEILILDEPTAHIDPENAERLVEIIRRFSGTKIIISHDLPILYQLCNRVIVLRQGRIVSDEAMDDFREDRNLISQFDLDHTYKCTCCQEIRLLQNGERA
jgi:cobalt transport protein ATP-binding subunit